MRHKIALVAMDLNPTLGTECGQADKWLRVLAERFTVDAFVDGKHRDTLLKLGYENVRFIFVDLDRAFVTRMKALGLYNVVNSVFARRVIRLLAARVHSEGYALIHCLTPMGVHSHNHYYRLCRPVVVGPLGGALDDPPGFQSVFGSIGLRNRLRNIFYALLPLSPSWRRYFNTAALVPGTLRRRPSWSRLMPSTLSCSARWLGPPKGPCASCTPADSRSPRDAFSSWMRSRT
jgi:hypothetical protein